MTWPSPRGRFGRGAPRSRPAVRSGSSPTPLRDVMVGDGHADVLRLAEHFVAPGAALAPRARGLGAAEGLAQVAHVLAVDEAHPRLHRRGNAMGAAEVPGPDVARQAVGDVVGLG